MLFRSVPCHEEHPLLLALAKQPGVRLYGINYKDDPAAARRFLGRYGNPFERLGAGEQFPRDLAVSTADWLVQDSPISPRRASMVVDPPNGRVPLKPEALEARKATLAQPSRNRRSPCSVRSIPTRK